MSSECIFQTLAKHNLGNRGSYPHDPDDFRRCYKLLQAMPEFKDTFHLMSNVNDVWKRLVDNWDTLTEMYERNVKEQWLNYKQVGMYEFMKKLGC